MRFFLYLVLTVSLAVLLIGGATAIHLFEKKGPLEQATLYAVPKGISFQHLAQKLEKDGVIDHAFVFYGAGRLRGLAKTLRAGEYEIPSGVSVKDLLFLLQTGLTHQRYLTIPEGLTVRQIVTILNEIEGLKDELAELPDEGSLLPETYAYSFGDRRETIIRRMQESLEDVLNPLWENRPDNFLLESKEDVIILASIVEKETGVAAERAKVAGVFLNRLKKGMLLQSDPTVIYPLSEKWGQLDRPLYRTDWAFDSPYNTYQYAGLPPGAIANPGEASLKAVFEPEDHDYLYFVADGTGGHVFAKTLAEHNRNVAQWRKIKKQKGIE